ncbi:hypothetical protein, partial [Klebsiella pneumoniae]|uniref:hypothetical protein n=1 Tax=Klebsiella pneumoniae TaxID=573 RepID=UPI001C5CF23F
MNMMISYQELVRTFPRRGNACKTMHPVDAWLNSGKIAVFSGIFCGATYWPVPCAGGHKSGSVR